MPHRSEDPVRDYERTYEGWRRTLHLKEHVPADVQYGRTYWSWRARQERARERRYAQALRRSGHGRLPVGVALRLRYVRRPWMLALDSAIILIIFAAVLGIALAQRAGFLF